MSSDLPLDKQIYTNQDINSSNNTSINSYPAESSNFIFISRSLSTDFPGLLSLSSSSFDHHSSTNSKMNSHLNDLKASMCLSDILIPEARVNHLNNKYHPSPLHSMTPRTPREIMQMRAHLRGSRSPSDFQGYRTPTEILRSKYRGRDQLVVNCDESSY